MTDCNPSEKYPHLAADYIKKHYPTFKAKVGIVLSSGLDAFTEALTDSISLDYADIPGFPQLTVAGHSGKLTLGYLGTTGVVCLQGRAHTYEGLENYVTVKNYVRTLKVLGCEYYIATNVSGSLREEVGPGEIMLIHDHINFQAMNPLVGPNDAEFGPRFYALDNAYNASMRADLLATAEKLAIPLHQGVYISVMGPNYETAAEIRAFKLWGADAVGMSTVPEVLVANHCGMKVAVLALITNHATGMAKKSHTHEDVVSTASKAAERLNKLLKHYISDAIA